MNAECTVLMLPKSSCRKTDIYNIYTANPTKKASATAVMVGIPRRFTAANG